MKLGLTSAEYQDFLRIVVRPLQNRGAQVWVFGSRARGDYKQFSDVDVLYSSQNGISLGDLAFIREAIEESNFPYKVDLVALSDIAESYRTQILSERVLVSN